MKSLVIAAILLSVGPACAVSLSQVIRDCGADGKALCKGVGYGQPMQDCIIANKARLSPACKKIAERLQNGDKVRLLEFGSGT